MKKFKGKVQKKGIKIHCQPENYSHPLVVQRKMRRGKMSTLRKQFIRKAQNEKQYVLRKAATIDKVATIVVPGKSPRPRKMYIFNIYFCTGNIVEGPPKEEAPKGVPNKLKKKLTSMNSLKPLKHPTYFGYTGPSLEAFISWATSDHVHNRLWKPLEKSSAHAIKGTIERFLDHLGHEDYSKVLDPQLVYGFADHLKLKNRSKKYISDQVNFL